MKKKKPEQSEFYDSLKPPRERKPAKRFAVEPQCAAKAAELSAASKHLIYLLVDEEGADLLRKGIVPEYVQRQAESALEWSLEDCGTKAAGW